MTQIRFGEKFIPKIIGFTVSGCKFKFRGRSEQKGKLQFVVGRLKVLGIAFFVVFSSDLDVFKLQFLPRKSTFIKGMYYMGTFVTRLHFFLWGGADIEVMT